MHLQQAIRGVFGQLAGTLEQLTPAQYTYTGKLLSQSSIGQHVRHIIELFVCLEDGYTSGTVNYEKRKRDRRIETDKDLAMGLLNKIAAGLNKDNRSLQMEAAYSDEQELLLQFDTN